MTNGYIRQSSGNIVPGHVIAAADLNAEFNALQTAFDATVGHVHDGTAGEGGLIPSLIFTGTTVTGTNTITITGTNPLNFQLTNGELITFTPAGINTSTAVTININGTGAIPLMKITGAGIVVPALGDLNPLSPVLIQYNQAGGYFLWILAPRSYALKISTATAINFAALYQFYIATTAVTFTVTQSTNLNNSWYCWIFAEGGNVTITPNAADSINGGTAGASVTLGQGNFAFITTDGAGNIYVTNTNYYFQNTFQTSGNFPITLTATGSTSVTLPTTGTLITSANVGTITSGVWNGTIISPTYGGTGVNNGSSTITIGGNVSISGAFTTALTVTANTTLTLPITGTLATLAGTEALTNKTINGLTVTSTTGTLTIASGKTATINNSLTLAGTDSTTITFQGTDTYIGRATTDTLTNKTLINPVISNIINTGTLTLPTSTDTLTGRATTDTLTNKTFDTAGTGNVFKINGAAITANTGTGSNVLASSPTLITPILGAASATSITFTSTTGVKGTATNDSAATGSVGEFIPSVIASGSAIGLTNNTPANITSISLTAGDWDVWGNVSLSSSSLSMSESQGWLSTTSATVPDVSLVAQNNTAGNSVWAAPVPQQRASLSGTTTIYLSVLSAFSGSVTACGGIYARRVR